MPCSTGARAGRAWRRVRLGIPILLLAGWAWPQPATPRGAQGLEVEIAQQVARAVGGRLGYRGLALARRESGEMLAGESRSFEIELNRGDQFLAVAACDEDCGDLDLELTGPRAAPWDLDVRPDAFPIAGGTAMRSGRYMLEVAMATCAERCRFSLAFLLAPVGAGAGGRDRLAEASRLHEGLIHQIRRAFAASGRELARVDGFQQPSLGGGREETFSVRVPRARRILVAADCDFGCNDLDLIVVDDSGTQLARDLEPDPSPRLWIDLPAPGTYHVTVRMEHCFAEPCAYAASVLAEATLPPAYPSSRGQGTCFAVHPDGLVATAAHVVTGAGELRVHLPDGSSLEAEIHGIDEESDLAVLRIPRRMPDALPLASGDTVALGQRVFTIGFPALIVLGEEPKFTDGVVAGLPGRSPSERAFQITVPLQPGSSGGPLVTEQGHVVGVVTAVANPDLFQAATGQLPQSVNYAARSEFLARLLPALGAPPPPIDRAQAIERARSAACWVEAIGEQGEDRARTAKLVP